MPIDSASIIVEMETDAQEMAAIEALNGAE
jgi:hypothetical protein